MTYGSPVFPGYGIIIQYSFMDSTVIYVFFKMLYDMV